MITHNLKAAREIAGLSQFAAARVSGIPRVRLSLAECGEVELNLREENALRAAIIDALAKRIAMLKSVLYEVQHPSDGDLSKRRDAQLNAQRGWLERRQR